MATTPTTEPLRFTQGDTVQWLKTLPDYPASAGWSLGYTLVNSAGKFAIDSTAQGDDHLAGASAAESDAFAPGEYRWQARVTKGSYPGSQVFTVGMGSISIVASLLDAAGGIETRSGARLALDAINAYLLDPNNLKSASYTIAGRSLTRHSMADLLALRSRLQAEVAAEVAADRAAAGLPDKRRIYVRFGAR